MSFLMVKLLCAGLSVVWATGDTAPATPAAAGQANVDADGSAHIDNDNDVPGTGEWNIVKEDWYRVVMANKSPIGYMLMKTVSNGTFFETSETMQITVRRGDTDTSTM